MNHEPETHWSNILGWGLIGGVFSALMIATFRYFGVIQW